MKYKRQGPGPPEPPKGVSSLEEAFYFIPGFRAVREAMTESRIEVEELWIAQGKTSARAEDLLEIAREKNITVRLKKTSELSVLFPDMAHQGVVALAGRFAYTELNQISEISRQGQKQALLIAADHITDEGNLGALVRTSTFFGAHGLIIPKDRSARVTSKVIKRSSGACIYMPIARVVNLGRALDLLDGKGFWIIGTATEAPETIYQFDWNRDLVLVLGNEGRGLSHSVRKRCHQVVGIPSKGNMGSLNVSVAGGIFLSEIVRQRNLAKA
jgi:23S rRNA (guanosine2251-2'-O)-methyltransferase